MSEPPQPPRGRWLGLPRWGRVLVVLGPLVALVGGWLWWIYPAHRIERALAEPRLPAGIELTDEVINDNGWICFDSCSWGNRYYLTTLPPEETANAVAAALRDVGWTAEVTRCTGRCRYDNPEPFHIGAYSWEVSFRGDGLSGYAFIGSRMDGRPGVDLMIGA